MISAADFKKQISKTFSGELKALGFKGSGFNYLMDTDNFVFAIEIQASRYGGKCFVNFGIQPKSIDTLFNKKLDFKKLKAYQCELQTRLAPIGKRGEWNYSDSSTENSKTVFEIIDLIKAQAIPVFNRFKNEPNILETIDTSDLENMHENIPKKFEGMAFTTSGTRLAWVLSKVFEKTNLKKAKEFANYGLSKSGNASTFFGIADFKNILQKKDL